MRVRRLLTTVMVALAGWTGETLSGAIVQDYQDPQAYQDNSGYEDYAMEARVWLDRGSDPVVQRGDQVRIYYRVAENAFVAIFHIDTNGTARMVFPSSPQESHYAKGGRDYRVIFQGSSYWFVNDDPGMGYFFIVTSPEPFAFNDFRYSHYAGGWDLSYVGRQVYGDPYLAMDDYVASLIPDWEYVAYGLDFTTYHVDQHYDYPRFLCYDCHGYRPYRSWNPYSYHCSSYRVVIYNDPYYYPVTRYRGTRVVYVQPRRGVAQFGFKERGLAEAGGPQVVPRNTAPRATQPGVEGTENRRAVPRTGAPSVLSPGTDARSGTATGQSRPGVEGTTNRRAGATTPGTATQPSRPSDGRGITTTAPRAGTTERPVLERRPASRGSGSTSTATTPPRVTPPRSSTTQTRPTSRVIRSRGGGTSTTRTPTVRGGGGTTTTRNPTVRSGGGTSTTRTPTVRPGGGSATTRTPTVRPGGGSTTTRTPTVRPGSRTPTTRTPTVRPGGGSTSSRPPTVRSTGGGATRGSPPRTTPPPKTRKPRRAGGGG